MLTGDQHEYCKSDTDSNQSITNGQNNKNLLQTQQDDVDSNKKSSTNSLTAEQSESQAGNNQQVSSASAALSKNTTNLSSDTINKGTTEISSKSEATISDSSSVSTAIDVNLQFNRNEQVNNRTDQATTKLTDSNQSTEVTTDTQAADNYSIECKQIENNKNNKNICDLV